MIFEKQEREREDFQYVLQIANEIIVVFLDFF